jgi:two-component system chemotaxis response regulator CheB
MVHRDIIVIGASAGGVDALKRIVSGLDPDLQAAVFVVLHLAPTYHSILPEILTNAGPLQAIHPHDGESIKSGRIFVAPPNNHMIMESGLIRLSNGPKRDHHRPSIDLLFQSAARVYNNRVIGVVLTGWGSDGTAGLAAVKQHGGIAIVQDPKEAPYNDMPRNAARVVRVDFGLKLDEIPDKLKSLSEERIFETFLKSIPEPTSKINDEFSRFSENESESAGTLLTCPECGGVLWEVTDGGLVKYTCHVGHSYAEQTLVEEQAAGLEKTLWKSVRLFREKAALARRLARRAGLKGRHLAEKTFRHDADEAEGHAHKVESLLLRGLSSSVRAFEAESCDHESSASNCREMEK